MTVSFNAALAAYRAAAGVAGAEAKPEAGLATGGSFADMIGRVGEQAVAAGRAADATTLRAIAGKADVTEVVTAVANAEVALQSVVAVRDKVIEAYQEIMRMPI
ncbi:MAG: flagellar hook-basal body complex protein FliE [Alphaproteobacteria bacterium]